MSTIEVTPTTANLGVRAPNPALEGIRRVIAAGGKHNMLPEEICSCQAMAIELDKATDLTVCFSQFNNPIKIDSEVLRKCPNQSMDAFQGIVGVTGEPCEAVLRHDADGNYVCTGNYCRKAYLRTEIDKANCPVCGEILWRKLTKGGSNIREDYEYRCIVSGDIFPREDMEK